MISFHDVYFLKIDIKLSLKEMNVCVVYQFTISCIKKCIPAPPNNEFWQTCVLCVEAKYWAANNWQCVSVCAERIGPQELSWTLVCTDTVKGRLLINRENRVITNHMPAAMETIHISFISACNRCKIWYSFYRNLINSWREGEKKEQFLTWTILKIVKNAFLKFVFLNYEIKAFFFSNFKNWWKSKPKRTWCILHNMFDYFDFAWNTRFYSYAKYFLT